MVTKSAAKEIRELLALQIDFAEINDNAKKEATQDVPERDV